jgi:putative endonuclease
MYYVYAIKSEVNGDIYIGYSTDLSQRMAEHNSGKANYTNRYKPWNLVYYESYRSKIDAQEREKRLKHHGKVWAHLKRRLLNSINES